jgi:hypothetical protein
MKPPNVQFRFPCLHSPNRFGCCSPMKPAHPGRRVRRAEVDVAGALLLHAEHDVDVARVVRGRVSGGATGVSKKLRFEMFW